jgi:hypothetical protein
MRFMTPMSDETAVMDYSAAIASAVAWLGQRYLLARPARRLTPEERRRADLTAALNVPMRRSRPVIPAIAAPPVRPRFGVHSPGMLRKARRTAFP